MSAASPKRRALQREEAVLETDGAQRVRLRFLPDGGEVRVPSGTPIFDAASWNGIAIDSTCGGHGTCKKCKVRIVSGDVPLSSVDPRAFTTDELRSGWRLACRASARGDLVVEVPPLQTRPKAALVGVGRHVILRPAVQKRHLVLDEPTLEDQRSDLQRVCDALDDLEPHASIATLRTLGGTLRRANFDVTAVVIDDELIDVEPGDTSARRFAIAFDLGTTTVVATLLDLESGQPAAVRSMLNRQQPFGADVITRVSATMLDPGALATLQQRAHETFAELTAEVLADADVAPGDVYEITVCGNVTMMQIALGIDPEPLSMAPFTVTTHEFPQKCSRGTSASRCTRGRRRSCSRRWAPMSAGTSWPGCWRRASPEIDGCGCSSTSAPTARSRSARSIACSPPPRPPGRRSRPPRSAAACGRPTARSRA